MPKNNQKKILELLKTKGALTAQTLSEDLSMTSMGARQLLLTLKRQQLVSTFDKNEQVGRPKKYWQLTQLGHSQFPDRHSELTLQMITSVKEVFGEQGLEQLIDSREKDILNAYLKSLEPLNSIKEKAEKLAEIRSAEGYMASVTPNDKGWLLIENHCPICAAATQCQNFCRSELDIFQACFENIATVSREHHLLSDGERCVYQITPIT